MELAALASHGSCPPPAPREFIEFQRPAWPYTSVACYQIERERERMDGPGERKAQAPTMLTWHRGERYQLLLPTKVGSRLVGSTGSFSSSSEEGVRSRLCDMVSVKTRTRRKGVAQGAERASERS